MSGLVRFTRMSPSNYAVLVLPAWLRPLKAGIAQSAARSRKLAYHRKKKHRTG